MWVEDQRFRNMPSLIPIRQYKATKQQNDKKDDSPLPKSKQVDENPFEEIIRKEDDQSISREATGKKINDKREIRDIRDEEMKNIDHNFETIIRLQRRKQEDQNAKQLEAKKKEAAKSKQLIGEMMRKINAKNISEELYPVTEETIQKLINQIERQIQELTVEADQKENSLVLNENNQHLKRELEALRKATDRCVTIKDLYHDKVNLRNKISSLERQVANLKDQNEKMRIKVSKDIDKIDKHMHNLPCERQRELEYSLRKIQKELSKQKHMRQSLEQNIQSIMLNFKRLHDQAETARQIVVRKLQELQERQQKLTPLETAHNAHRDYRYVRQPSRQNPLLAEPQLSTSQVRQDPVINDKSHSGYSTRQSPERKKRNQNKPPSSSGSNSFLQDQIRNMRSQQNYFKGRK